MSRNTHDRMTSHHGDLPDDHVGITESIGPFPVGTSVDMVLAWISNEIAAYESSARLVASFFANALIAYRFYVDAVIDLARLWRDTLVRTGSLGDSEGTSTFGTFPWKVSSSSTYTPDIFGSEGINYIRGSDYLNPEVVSEASIYGYPLITTGIVEFDYMPANDGDHLEMGLQRHGEGVRIGLNSLGGYLYELVLGDNPGIWVSVQWPIRIKVRFCPPGQGSIGFPDNWFWYKAWYPQFVSEPGSWNYVYLDPQVGDTLPVIRFTQDVVAWVPDHGLGQITVTKLDSDPWQMYGQISVDAVIA